MVIKAKQEEEVFRPITITIVLKTQKELSSLIDIFGNHTTKSFCNTPNGPKQCLNDDICGIVSKDFLPAIYTALTTIKK